MKLNSVREMYEIQFERACMYYSQETGLTADKITRLANIFAIKNTWIEYNNYCKKKNLKIR